ncbi:MAG: hypothetical protein ACI9RZ_002436 [Sphingobacteriales bacterium]|jgi:hypothetical protein
MKKLFTAVPMKKLLIATSILAMSSTAIAATDDKRNTDSITTDSLTVDATYVETLAVSLSLDTIDFGEIFTGATVDNVLVTANVSGDGAEPFAYKVETSGSIVTLDGGTADLAGTGDLSTGTGSFTFNVNVKSDDVTDTFAQETITTTVNYTAIAGTTTTPA